MLCQRYEGLFSQVVSSGLKLFRLFVTVTSEDACCSMRNVKLILDYFSDHAQSMCYFCIHCSYLISCQIEMTKEQECL